MLTRAKNTIYGDPTTEKKSFLSSMPLLKSVFKSLLSTAVGTTIPATGGRQWASGYPRKSDSRMALLK